MEIKENDYVKLKDGTIWKVVSVNKFRPPECKYALENIFNAKYDLLFVGDDVIEKVINQDSISDILLNLIKKRQKETENFKDSIFDELCNIEFILKNIDRENNFKVTNYTKDERIKKAIDRLINLEHKTLE